MRTQIQWIYLSLCVCVCVFLSSPETLIFNPTIFVYILHCVTHFIHEYACIYVCVDIVLFIRVSYFVLFIAEECFVKFIKKKCRRKKLNHIKRFIWFNWIRSNWINIFSRCWMLVCICVQLSVHCIVQKIEKKRDLYVYASNQWNISIILLFG